MPVRTLFQVFTANGTWTAPWNLAFPPAVFATGESATAGTSSHGVRSGPGSGAGAVGGEPGLGGVVPGTVLTVTVPGGSTGLQTSVTGGAVPVLANPGLAPVTTTGGLGGAAGTNTVAQPGGNGSNAITGASVAGGGGGGSAGSTGPGGSTTTSAAGAAGTGPAGPPSLAGAAGAVGGTALNPGNNGIAPGSGASGGGSGGSINHAGGLGVPGQAVIIWQVFDLPPLVHPAPFGRRGQQAVVLAPFPVAAPPSTPTAPTIRPGILPPRPGRRGRLVTILAPFPAPAPPSPPTAPTIRPARVPPRPGRRGRLAVTLAPFPPPQPPPVSRAPYIPGDILKPWRKRAWPRVPLSVPWELAPDDGQAPGLETPSDPGAPGRPGADTPQPGPGAARLAVAAFTSAAARRAATSVDTGNALKNGEIAESLLYWQQKRTKKGSK